MYERFFPEGYHQSHKLRKVIRKDVNRFFDVRNFASLKFGPVIFWFFCLVDKVWETLYLSLKSRNIRKQKCDCAIIV